MSRFYLTTAIDYPNGVPHIGHAYERVGADAIARYQRLRGEDVYFLVGMDEHAQKVTQAAAAEGTEPRAFVDRLAGVFQRAWDRLQVSYDVFYRTTDPSHQAGIADLIERIYRRRPDDFFEGKYEGWYCTGCEYFKRDSDIVDGHCILHPTRQLEWLVEHNWFFRLSNYRDFLLQYHADHPDFLQPEARRNEIIAILKDGLEDISVSRGRLGWGIPWPRALSNGEQQVVWVWFDALPNYLTATGYPGTRKDVSWPAQLHIVGKDITRLHAIIWPAILEAAGLPLPERVWGHGFALFKGEKLSKSSGVVLDLDEAIDRHGPDALRYFLLREIPWDADGTYTWERFDERYTADLADGLGNLASRVLAMITRYRGGVIPAAGETELDRTGLEAATRYREAMDALLLHRAAAAAWDLVSAANVYVDQRAPWVQAKNNDTAGLDETLGALARALGRLAILVSPFLPGGAEKLWVALGSADFPRTGGLDHVSGMDLTGRTVTRIPPLFPKPEAVPGRAP